jgi:dienelactone hydrolase
LSPREAEQAREAGSDPSKGAAYDERADRRSWQAMQTFFHEVLM